MTAPQNQLPMWVVYAMLVFIMVLWSATLIITRAVHQEIPPIGLSFWRWVLVAVALIPVIAPRLGREGYYIRRAWKQLVVQGVLLISASTMAIISVNFTTAINATLVNAAQPTATVLIAWILMRDRITPLQMLGVAAAIFGIAVMVSKGDWQVARGLQFAGGDFWMMLAIVFYASYAVRLRKLPPEIGQATVLFFVAIAGSVLVLPVYLWESIYLRPVPFNQTFFIVVVYIALLPSLLGMFIWQKAIQRVGASRAAIFINLMPVFGAAMAVFFLGENLFAFHVIGAALVCAGILMVVRGHRKTAGRPLGPDPAPEETG